MKFNGLAKLVEECGELAQVGGKALQVGGLDKPHWNADLIKCFIEEAGDLIAAIKFVADEFDIDLDLISARIIQKESLFNQWATETREE